MRWQAWVLEYLTLFRVALLAVSCGYCFLSIAGFRPGAHELRAAVMAAWVQFSLGILAEIQIVRLGSWVYQPMPFSLGGVPLDFHADWALVLAFPMVWAYGRVRCRSRMPGFTLAYLGAWTVLTWALDALMGERLLFRRHVSPTWWLVDLVFLAGVFGTTLWIYHSMLFPPGERRRLAWNCRIRSVLYVGSLAYLFYIYLPGVVLSLTDGWKVAPLLPRDDWRVLTAAVAPSLLLGAWATWSFTDTGLGTPVPLDPPRSLVTTGPYAFVRNPMQIAGLMLATLLVLYYPTPYMLLYVIDLALLASVLFHVYECGQLQRTFGGEYARYRRHVRNWLPRWHPYVSALPCR